jgi:hypothetical protein
LTLDDFLVQLKERLHANNWQDMDSNLVRMDLVVKAADAILELPGTWILVNADQTLRELLTPEN